MNAHQIFESYILPELINIAEQINVTKHLLSIALYGSSNYDPEFLKSPEHNLELRDYDIWITFQQEYFRDATKFATKLFDANFTVLTRNQVCILYDKIILKTNIGNFLIAPMIVTEESYGIFHTSMSNNRSFLIPWYRPRSRERLPVVPICSKELKWSAFDMHQIYLSKLNLWKLLMPALIRQKKIISIGTFVECALSGECFFGNFSRHNELKKILFIDAIKHLHLREYTSTNEIPLAFYQMLTIASKAEAAFKDKILDQFSQWLQ